VLSKGLIRPRAIRHRQPGLLRRSGGWRPSGSGD
jgi:hypothetical protein